MLTKYLLNNLINECLNHRKKETYLEPTLTGLGQ